MRQVVLFQSFFLNISNIRPVTENPPTILRVAKAIAIKRIILSNWASPTSGYIRIAAINVMPEIALEPDINGVCNVCGILDISSYPIKLAKNVINNVSKKVASIMNSSQRKFHLQDYPQEAVQDF